MAQPYFAPPAPKHRLWLHALLLVLTLLTTSFMGARLAENFSQNVPAFQDDGLSSLQRMAQNPLLLVNGLPFSLTLLVILMAHEMGHYVACVYYRIDASLPYFLPAPTLMGTLGAFIRLRTPIYTRKALFDVGVAGPLAGFLFLLPALAIGVAYGKVLPQIATRGELSFGVPMLEWGMRSLIFPGVGMTDFYLHPIGRAAWVGMLATALNLLPIGQLDGGHLLYALLGERCRIFWKLGVVALIPMGFLYSYTWLFWAAFLGIFALRHPPMYDEQPVGRGRVQLALLSLVIFVICFTLEPVGFPLEGQ
jgi:membrane-associated protease RseP (regulator of RpoE activity)